MVLSIHTLKSSPRSRRGRKKRGRGNASGHGNYSGRGGKGQTARSGGTRRPGFAGGQTPLVRLMPKFRGFSNPTRVSYQVLNVSQLNIFEDGATVNVVALYEKNLISRKKLPVKILGEGELNKKLSVKVDAVSKTAKEKIEAKGGTIA